MTCFKNMTVKAITWTGMRIRLIVPPGEVMRLLINALPVKIEERAFHKMAIQNTGNC